MLMPSFLRPALSFIVAALLISCSESTEHKTSPIRPVKAMLIGNAKSFNNRSFPGKARASQEVDLSFNESGSLIELPINIGTKVKKGDLIARLDPKAFEAKLKAANAEVLRDKQNYLRAQELIKKGHISKADFDLLKAKLAVAESNMELAQKSLNDSVIHAPFDGEIADRYVENYQTVSKQQVIARLLDSAQIEMVIQIPENAISFIPNVKDIVVQFDSFPDHQIPAQIKEISSEASLDTRTYPVTLIMKQPKDIEILPGMAGKAKGRVEQNNKQMKITIPVSALITIGDGDKSYVWLIDPKTKRVHRQSVVIGELSGTGVSVIKGLQVNDWVVTAGVHFLDEGREVIIMNQQGSK